MQLVDSHCHFDFAVFDEDRAAVMQRAVDNGIGHIVMPGVDRHNWDKIATLSEQDPRLSACYGLHPYHAEQHQPDDLDALKDFVEQHDCVAIGECGLDYRDNQAPRQTQQYYFEAQLQLAAEKNKPVVMHAVKATEHIIQSLKACPVPGGMVHSYSGSYEQAVQLIDLGMYIGVGGAITHDAATRLRKTVTRLPAESLLLEADAPDQPGNKHRGERNEPAWLREVVLELAALRGTDADSLAQQTTNNAARLFGLAL